MTPQFSLWPRPKRTWISLSAGAAAIWDENRRELEASSYILAPVGDAQTEVFVEGWQNAAWMRETKNCHLP
jgi:hypothetical protein